jgi:acetyl esterase/lipase
VLEDLIAIHGLGAGTQRVLLTGGSAGGQATYLAADWVQSAILPRTRFPS